MSTSVLRLAVVLFGLAGAGLAHATDLTVSAAASLTNAFREIATAFEAAHPGVKVQLNFGASGALLQQIAKGAPVDVFASADEATMDAAQAQGLMMADQRRNFARNSLVVVVPAGSTLKVDALSDLASPAVKRVGIGVPASVPVGRYTQSVLEAAGLWRTVEAKMVGAQSVRQALDYVARGEVDAAFVYATDAALMPDRVRAALWVPTKQPVLYPAAPVKGSANAALARQFVDFLLSDPAQVALGHFGFGEP